MIMKIVELVALSVALLAAELETGGYTADELNEALAAETAGDNRSTAIKEIKAALADAMSGADKEPEGRKPGLYVCAGKSITTAAGIKGPGDEIKEGMLHDNSRELLVEKGYLEVEK